MGDPEQPLANDSFQEAKTRAAHLCKRITDR